PTCWPRIPGTFTAYCCGKSPPLYFAALASPRGFLLLSGRGGAHTRDHVSHDLGGLCQDHIRQLGLVLLDLLDRLERRQVLRGAAAVLAIEPLLLQTGALFAPGLEVQRYAVLLADRVDGGDVRHQPAVVRILLGAHILTRHESRDGQAGHGGLACLEG